MATTAEGQAKLKELVASGVSKTAALKQLIAEQKAAKSAPATIGNSALLPLPTTTTAPEITQLPAAVAGEATMQPLTTSPGVAVTNYPTNTGNTAIDSANILASILNSPLYNETIKNSYLSEWLPGITQSTYEINAARAQEVKDNVARQQAQADAIRSIAGSYAARGMRTPEMVRRGFEPVQATTAEAKNAAEQNIAAMQNVQDITYGTGAQDQGSFVSNPAAYGSVGAGARRAALSELQSLPTSYGLTQVDQASSAPLASQAVAGTQPTEAPATSDPLAGLSSSQLQAKIDAANKYISSQQAKGNAKTVAGATTKLTAYQDALKAALGGN